MTYNQEFENDFETSEFEEEFTSDFESDAGEGDFEFESETDGEGAEPDWDKFEEESLPAVAARGRTMRGGGDVQNKIAQQRAAIAKLRVAIPKLARHLKKEGNRYRLGLKAKSLAEAASRLGVPPATVRGMLQALKRGNMRLAGGGSAQSREVDSFGDFEMDSETGTCPGVTAVSTHWWGIRLMLNECHTAQLLNALAAGSSAGSVCSAIAPLPHVKVICGLAGGLIGLGAAAIKAIDALGGNKGIIIRKPWVSIPPAPPVLIWHQ